MKFKSPVNENYCGRIVTIDAIEPIENCDNIVLAIVAGYQVIVGKDFQVGMKGVLFTTETKLSDSFLKHNNMYRHKEKNQDTEQRGFIEDNGRLKAIRLRGNKSEGLFTPLSSLNYLLTKAEVDSLKVGDIFDKIKEVTICEKYVVKKREKTMSGGIKEKKSFKSRMIQGQFRFHRKTGALRPNFGRYEPNDIVSITKKLHGTSVVISNILIKRKGYWFYSLLNKIGIPIRATEYAHVCSSRKVIKSHGKGRNLQGYYKEDLWSMHANKINHLIPKGVTIYGEIVGYTPSGVYIQNGFDYGCKKKESELYVYRITSTDEDGNVFEYSMKDVQSFCEAKGLKSVPLFFYGKILDIYPHIAIDDKWRQNYLKVLEHDNEFEMNDSDCSMCVEGTPSEGIVFKREDILNPYACKMKNFRFLEAETKSMDKGQVDIEEVN